MPISTCINLYMGGGGGSEGSAFVAQTRADYVDTEPGVTWIGTTNLAPVITVTNKTGDSNLEVSVIDDIQIKVTTTDAIPSGEDQTVQFKVNGSDGCIQPWTVTLTGRYNITDVVETITPDVENGYVVSHLEGVPPDKVPVFSGSNLLSISGSSEEGWDLVVIGDLTVNTVIQGVIKVDNAMAGHVTVTVSGDSLLQSPDDGAFLIGDDDEYLTSS